MTTENQNLGLMSPEGWWLFWQYSVPVTILGCQDPTQTTGWALGFGTELSTFKSTYRLRRYYRVSIHIKSFGIKFRYLRTHIGRIREERGDPCDMMSPLQLFKNTTHRANEMFWSVVTFLGSYGLEWWSPFIKTEFTLKRGMSQNSSILDE